MCISDKFPADAGAAGPEATGKAGVGGKCLRGWMRCDSSFPPRPEQ